MSNNNFVEGEEERKGIQVCNILYLSSGYTGAVILYFMFNSHGIKIAHEIAFSLLTLAIPFYLCSLLFIIWLHPILNIILGIKFKDKYSIITTILSVIMNILYLYLIWIKGCIITC